MMVSNMTDGQDQTDAAPMSGTSLAMRFGIATVGAVFFSGMLAGLTEALSQEERIKPVGYAIIAVFAALTLGSLWFAWASGRRYYRENGPFTPRGRRATMSAAVACVIGMAVGAGLSLSGDAPSQPFDFMEGPLPSDIAAGLIALIILVLAPITWFWHRNIDEHEEQSYRTGALVALYFYSAAAPIWWLGERGGFLPPADGTAIYFATMGVWAVVWFRQRYL